MSILQHKYTTIFVVAQVFQKNFNYFFSQRIYLYNYALPILLNEINCHLLIAASKNTVRRDRANPNFILKVQN